jgi:hypothetical protein
MDEQSKTMRALETANEVLAPWLPSRRRTHRHLMMALFALGLLPWLRPDLNMPYLMAAWLALPFLSPRIRQMVVGFFRRG